MNILTDEELMQAGQYHCALENCRAIEAAIIKKLNSAKPVIYIQPNHLDLAKRQVFLCRSAPYKEHDDFVSLYEHPPAPSAVEWQPIETAPKDGTNILLINTKGNMATGLWQGALGIAEGWWIRGGNFPDVFFNAHHGPTHWMPLPQPPMAAARSE